MVARDDNCEVRQSSDTVLAVCATKKINGTVIYYNPVFTPGVRLLARF